MAAKDTPVAIASETKRTYWTWCGHQIHYVQQGQQGPSLLLIHGFGASTDHWRKNIAGLCQNYRVWAIDLLGFGRSAKPKLTYTSELWRDQLRDFCRQVVQEPVFIAGNSLGGYAALCLTVDCPELAQGVILINCAGPFSEDPQVVAPDWQRQLASLRRQLFQLPFVIEVSSFFLFNYLRQRSVIRRILLSVYSDPMAVTDRLVEEIYQPALDQGALHVFSAVFKSPPGRKLDELLQLLKRPLLLLWGTADPWMMSSKTEQFRIHYPSAELKLIDAGHCPHDERPVDVNATIDRWIAQQL